MQRRPPKPPLSPWLTRLAWVSMGLAVVVLTLPFKIVNSDLWVHIKVGEYVLTHGRVPTTDLFSFTAADRAFVAHEWLSSVLLALIDHLAGPIGLMLGKTVLVGLTYLLIVLTARRLGASLSVILPAFAVLLYIVSARVVERPHLFSWLFLALYLWLWVRYRTGGMTGRWLWLFVPLQMLWANLHGGHIQGLALLGCCALGEAAMWMRAHVVRCGQDTALPRAEVIRLAACVPACLAASCLTPYGAKVLLLPFELTRLTTFMESTTEWRPPYLQGWYFRPWFYGYALHLLTLWTAWMAVSRDRRYPEINRVIVAGVWLTFVIVGYSCLHPPVGRFGDGGWVPPVLATMLYSLLGLWIVCALVNWHTVNVTQAAIVALFYAVSVRHMRAVPDAALVTFPILAASTSTVFRRVMSRASPSPQSILVGVGLLMSLTVFTSLKTYYPSFQGPGRLKGVGIVENCAIDVMAQHQLTGRVYNSFALSPLLIYRTHPALLVSVHTFDYVIGERLFLEYADALKSGPAFERYLTQYDVNVVFLELRHFPVAQHLDAMKTWALVHLDDRAFVMVREPQAQPVYASIRPWENALVTPGNASQVLQEANRALEACPEGATFAWAYKAEALRVLGRDHESFEARLKIPERLMIE